MASLLPPRDFVTSLISSIRTSTIPTTTSNPLSDASTDTRKALLTLHVLFPNELLPALDLLDRGLVTRLKIKDEAQQRQASNPQPRLPLHQEELQADSANESAPRQREVQELHRPFQDPGRLGLVGDPERQHPRLGPLPGLREVQPQGQSEVQPSAIRVDHRTDESQLNATSKVQSQIHINNKSKISPIRRRNPADQALEAEPHTARPQSHRNQHPANPSLPALAQIQHHHDRQSPDGPNPPHRDARPAPGFLPHPHHAGVYVVRSGQFPAGVRVRGRQAAGAAAHAVHYEVRLSAWSCSCPAFAFAAFPAASGCAGARQGEGGLEGVRWRFGGLALGDHMPVCKHLLACVLVEHCGVFAEFVEERDVGVEELAGWAAGWGN